MDDVLVAFLAVADPLVKRGGRETAGKGAWKGAIIAYEYNSL
jgi:hypothetical protein